MRKVCVVCTCAAVLAVLLSTAGYGAAALIADGTTYSRIPDYNTGTYYFINMVPDPPPSGVISPTWGWFKFDTSSLASYYNSLYGSGGWRVTKVRFGAYNYGHTDVYAGYMSAGYNSVDNWSETGITWNTQPTRIQWLSQITVPKPAFTTLYLNTWDLGTYAPLVADIVSGDPVTINMRSDGGYANFASREFGTGSYAAVLNISVIPVPEPAGVTTLVFGFGAGAALVFRRKGVRR